MNVKNVWLLSVLVLMLAFGLFVGKGSANITNIEGTDATGQYTGNDFAIRGISILMEGDIGGNAKVNLGNLQVNGLDIKRGSLETGGNLLVGTSGTSVNATTSEVTTNNQGEYVLTFVLPFDAALGTVTFGFTNNAANPAGEDDTYTDFVVQNPQAPAQDTWDINANYDDEDVFKNGGFISYEITLEENNDEIEAVTILVDPRAIDNTFGVGVSGLPAANVAPATWEELAALELAVKNAIAAGKLVVTEDGGGDYTVSYTISATSTASPGSKSISIYAYDFPSRFTSAQIKAFYKKVGAWTGQTDAQLFAHLDKAHWMNGVDYDGDTEFKEDFEAYPIILDNIAPNFDFAMISPFSNSTNIYTPPKVVWVDKNSNGIVNDDEVNYAFKPGDKVSIMIQVDPDDLNLAEFDKVDLADISSDMVENMGIRNIKVIGDISALLDPTKVNLTTDTNKNGIPDVAEITAAYAGNSGGDDDLDKADTKDGVDEEDFTTNGFYEPFMFVVTFTIDDKFRAASGTNPATVPDLPFRFMIEDAAGNQGHYSSWKETYNITTKKWVSSGNWERDLGLVNGNPFPVRVDDAIVPGPNGYIPNVGLFPVWNAGNRIVENWQNPWLIRIDNWAPSVSRVDGLNLKATTDDPLVKMGAAVVTEQGDPVNTNPPTPDGTNYQRTAATVLNSAGQNVLSTVGTGNFIYEISGNEGNLVSLKADFPSDNDMDHVVFQYSEVDSPGSYKPMKGQFSGDRDVFGLPDMAGNYTDPDIPGAIDGGYHDGISGDDDADGDADMNDSQVRAAILHPQSDGIDNDGDGLVDAADVDINGNNTDYYDPSRDEDEDGIMDEDECYVRTASPAVWTFDPVRIARTLKLVPGKAYAIKAFAYDKAGNVLETAAAPVYVIFNVVGKGVQEIQGTAKATLYKGTQQITGKFIPENNQYTLEATTTGTVNSVTFQYSLDGTTWETISADPNPDNTAPFKAYWTPKLSPLAGLPGGYLAGDDLFIRALPTKLGNLGKYKPSSGLTPDMATFIPYDPLVPGFAPESTSATPDITVAVTDASAPVLVIVKAGTPGSIDDNMADGALLQVAKDVTITAEAIVPSVFAHDIANAVFQYAMSSPDGTVVNWVDIPGTVDKYIIPKSDGTTLVQAVVKWDTTVLVPGNVSKRFDLRCVATDVTGNSDPQLAPIVHVVVGKGKYAAFISDPNAAQTLSGTAYTVEAFVYNKSTDPNSIKTVIFQFQKAGGPWTNIDSVANGDTLAGALDSRGIPIDSHGMIQKADFSVWHGNWDIRDLSGDIKIRALTEDDRGYINEGLEVAVKVAGVAASRANISNFVSDATKNPRVSKQIARAGSVADITIVDNVGVVEDTLQVVLKATIASGTAEKVEFQYLVNPSVAIDPARNPKKDSPAVNWITIGTDTDGADGWTATWKITPKNADGSVNELYDSQVAKLVYVRAVAYKTAADPNTKDKYTDESNYVPYVGFVFEELHKPTTTFAKIQVLRDGVTKDMGTYAPSAANDPATWLAKEMRVTGGTMTFVPYIVDQGTEDHRASGVTKVELFYKPYYKPSVNPDNTAVSYWIKAAEDAEAPFAIDWDITKVTSGKYDIMLVSTDQVGNKSANIFNIISNADNTGLRNLGLTKILNIDLEGPLSYIEDPDTTHNGGKLALDAGNNGLLTVAVGSSCNGGVKLVKVFYSLQAAIPPDVRTGEGTYTFQYLDTNNNGQYDTGEPFYLINPPGQGSGIPQVGTGTPSWVEIATVTVDYTKAPFSFGASNVYSKFSDFASTFGYYYYDANGNGKYEVGEPVWKDEWKTGGNTGKYNNHARTITETVVLGASTPPDEAPGTRFEAMSAIETPVWLCTGTSSGVVKWADLDNNGELGKADFIWIDLNGDNKFTYTDGKNLFVADPGGMAEPIIYAPIPVTWPALTLLDLPPTNNSTFDLRVLAQDRNDSVSNEGNWGPEYTGKIRVENIKTVITAVNTKAIADYKADTSLWRVTGNTATVTVRVWPRPIDGAKIQLWFRYDDDLYPGAADADLNGLPDNGLIANSRYDGIDNDWDGTIDEDQADAVPGTHDPDWGEANTWQLAQTTGGTTVTGTGAADNIVDNKWFEVKLTWDTSMLKDEFQYQIVPIVVDGQNYGNKLNYPSLPWTRSDARFPQGTVAENIIKMIVDHQGPYSFTQVVQNTDGIADTERTLDSWTALAIGSPDDLIVRTNDSWNPVDSTSNTVGPGNQGNETDNNLVTYDTQIKTVSIFGGLDYTKTFTDKIGGVEIQYRDLPSGTWKTLGFDYDPDYMSSFYFDGTGKLIEDPAPNLDRGLANNLGWTGAFIMYYGKTINASAANAATVVSMDKLTSRVVEATWSIDNLPSILDIAKFPWTNGTEYEFRAIAKDLPDAWGSPGISTNGDITTATAFDEYVIRGVVGADAILGNSAQQSFLRDIYWKLGVPFNFVGAKSGIFTQPITDGINNRMEVVLGPRDDGKDSAYWVDNIVPKSSIIGVDTKAYAWTPEAGVDPNAVAAAIDAEVMEGDDVLVTAIVNADPEKKLGASVWGNVQGDISQVKLYGKSGSVGWKVVGMGNPGNIGGGTTGQTEYGNSFTFRIDTAQLVKDLGIATSGTRDVTLAAVAIDDNGNQEGLVAEIVIRVNDMVGPKIKLGGLALDILQLKNVLDNSTNLTGVGSALASFISNGITGGIGGSVFEDPKFVDVVNLDLNNFGNAVFPGGFAGDVASLPTAKRLTTKVSGEVLDLYLYNPRKAIGEIPTNGVTVTVYDKNNTPVVKKTASYSIDKRVSDTEVDAAKIAHTFVLSENAARIYLPTWTENGKTKSRFEGVRMYYATKANIALPAGLPAPPSDLWTGTNLVPANQPFGDSVALTPTVNSKGEPIWSVTMNLDAGTTYFYYFVVDTVGDTWAIPDPKNLSFDVGTGSMVDWWKANQQYIMLKNWFINLPVMSKIWVPGTPEGNNVVDDELWFTSINLDGLADGGYEVRVDVKDSAGLVSQAAVSKTIVVDRTPPAVDPTADIKVAGRVKANSSVPVTAVLKDQAGINAVDTSVVLFEVSRRGNTQEAISTWQYALSTEDRPIVRPELQSMIDYYTTLGGKAVNDYNWLKKIAMDVDSADGWSIPWQTPNTDQNVKYFVRAVPIDDALNVQVDQTNQVEVWVDGTVPKAKVLTASVNRGGTVVADGADGFEVLPTDKDVTLTARIEANSDGDLNLDGIIDPGAGENVNNGIKSVKFQYTLRELASLNTNASIIWYDIPATQYSNAVLAPNADGSWSATWQVDFSKLYDAEKDQYLYLRAVAEDEVGNKDESDPILAVMVLNDVTGPAVQIKQIKGPLCGVAENALSPHLAVSRGMTDVMVKFSNKVAAIKLDYRAVGAATWTEIKTISRTANALLFADPLMTIQWDTSRLEVGKYELQATSYDGDGNPTPEPHSIIVVVDYTNPVVTLSSVALEVGSITGITADDGTWYNYEVPVNLSTGIFRYATAKTDALGNTYYFYYGVQIKVKADATDPTDKVEAKTVVLQYFDRSSATWQTVKTSDGKDAVFSYNKASDLWTATFPGDVQADGANRAGFISPNALGRLIPGLKNGVDGELWLRGLATDYACNDNKLDKGTKFIADANPPSIISVLSGGISYEGGSSPTIVEKGGDSVDLWAKVTDAGGAGVASVTFKYISTNNPISVPVYYANGWSDIAPVGAKTADNGVNSEEIWRSIWSTPRHQPAANQLYSVAVTVTDKAGNSVETSAIASKQATVKVEKDVTAPAAPIVAILDTHSTKVADKFKYTSMGSYDPVKDAFVQVFTEVNAANYSQKKRLPIDGDNYKKYEVFNTFYVDENADGIEDNGVDNGVVPYKDSRKDTKLVIFAKTQKLEYGSQVGTDRDPSLAKVYLDYAFDPNQDGDPSDITTWTTVFNNTADTTVADNIPMLLAQDLRWVPVWNADATAINSQNYYFVMGDNSSIAGFADIANEQVVDTATWADGMYIFRTKAVDTTGNVGPYGYAKFLVHNKDTIVPARSTIISLNGTDDTTKWVPLEWKWHKVIVRTYRNQVGSWWMGATGKLTNATPVLDATLNDYSLAEYGKIDVRNRFFSDINKVYVEAYDNESKTWVNITKDSYATGGGVASSGDDSFAGLDNNRSRFYTDWTVWVDSTLVGDGNTKMRPLSVDNASVGEVSSVAGTLVGATGLIEAVDTAKEKAIMVDNPRATVVLPASGTVVERGITELTIQAVPTELAGWDTASNGDDVGQMTFLVRRKAAPNGGINGPYILLDAKDNDLDGKFGEDPVAGKNYDKDGASGEDGVDPVDTNAPYMVHWKIPDWLVIDDPQTEKVIEQTADYWVIAVAGDANTGPLDSKNLANIPVNQIHWDNPSHIYRRTNRFALITVVDNHPPKTRVLQVGSYKVPSEVKMIVGKTVTVFAGDTEVDWVPPDIFPAPDYSKYAPITNSAASPWPADAAPWTYGMLYPVRYNPDVVWENQLVNETRANNRVTLRYAGPFTATDVAPAFPTSGQSWDDTKWKSAEADAIHMDVDNATGDPTGLGNPGVPRWQVTNWVTGGPILPDGKYFITITGTDDIGHVTGVPVGNTEPVMPDIAEIWIKNTTKPIQLAASQLLVNGTLTAITNKEMERGEPMVLVVDPKINTEDLNKVRFEFKAQHDYNWSPIATIETQPYSTTLDPRGNWDAQTGSPANIVLGAVYQFRAVGIDSIGNEVASNTIELTVVDKIFMASIAKIQRIDGLNADETTLDPEQINQTNNYPRLTGRVCFTGYTDSDVVGTQMVYRAQGATSWTDIETMFKDGNPGTPSWTSTGYSYAGMKEWSATWDTTTLQDGVYQVAIIAVPWSLTTAANTGQKMPEPSDILNVVVDHNAYDIFDNVTENTPKDGEAVGGWTRRPVASQNPILTPDQKEMIGPRGEVDLWVTFGKGFADLDMGIPTQGTAQGTNLGTALMPALSFEYKESAYPNVGDETKDDTSYWKPINAGGLIRAASTSGELTDVIYDAATKRFSTIWPTAALCHDNAGNTIQVAGAAVLNGYYDIRVRLIDEAGNVAYKVIARRVIVDNTAPDVVISNIAGDTTLTYASINQTTEEGDPEVPPTPVDTGLKMATDTGLNKDDKVVVRATAVDSLTSVAYIQFQVRVDKLAYGLTTINSEVSATSNQTVGIGDLLDNNTMYDWVDIGLATKDADPADSYSLLWDTTGLFEGDYRLRVKATDRLGNMDYSSEVIVTVIDTTPPIATIVGYYPNQLHFLNWPKKYWYDTLYAATTCQADIQEVQFQYRGIADSRWTTIGIPVGYIESVDDKLGQVSKIVKKLFPTSLAATEAITELFNWTSLWGATWNPNLADGTYQLRAVAKDWSGNVAPELAPILTVSVVNGVVKPVTPGSGIKIDFTANLGGTGIGDRSGQNLGNDLLSNYTDTPTVVVEVEAPDKPLVFMLFEFQAPEGLSFDGGVIKTNPNGLIVAGELLDMKPVVGESGKYAAALTGGELPCMIINGKQVTYLDLLRFGGKLIAFATTNNESASTSLMTDDLKIYPVTAELGTNGTAVSKDGNVTVTIPRAALTEPQLYSSRVDRNNADSHTRISGTYVEKLGLMITPSITPNTPKNQRLLIEPVGQAYSVEMFDYWSFANEAFAFWQFRPGFEPTITIDYSGFGIPADQEANGFVSVRYWEPQPNADADAFGGAWANDDIINLSVDKVAKKVSFSLSNFGYWNDEGNLVPHNIYSIVLEKSLGRVDEITFFGPDRNYRSDIASSGHHEPKFQNPAFRYNADPSISYLSDIEGGYIQFRVVDPAGIDRSSIKLYIDGQLYGAGSKDFNVAGEVTPDKLATDKIFYFQVPEELSLTEGIHVVKIDAWDKSDAVDESDWQQLEGTARFFIDTTPPQVVTQGAQKDGIRYFKSVAGATAAITLVDEGVGLSAADLQKSINVDVFKWLNAQTTPLRTGDQGNIINYQRKTLIATSKPVIEYADNYTADGIDNETWMGIADGASSQRHKAWRASYNIQVGNVVDGETYEVVFYAQKPQPMVLDLHNENAVYLYEDLTKAYLAVWKGDTADNLSVSTDLTLEGIVSVPATQVPDFYKLGVANLITTADPFTGYYQGTFLNDILGNGEGNGYIAPLPGIIGGILNGGTDDTTTITAANNAVSSAVTSSSSSSSGYYYGDISYFVRHLVADTRGPVVTLNVPQGVKADDPAATVSGTIIDDGSGIAEAKLVINGVVKADKKGPISNVTLEYTFGKGEVVGANEIKIVVVDLAGNETVTRGSFGVQEMDAPAISDMSPEGDGITDATPTINAAYADKTGIDLNSVTLTLNGAVLTDVTIGQAKVSYTPTSPLKAGVVYTVKLAVKDIAGVPSEKIWTFSIEKVAPSITDTTPTGVDKTGTPIISAKFADAGTGINKDSVSLRIDKSAVDAQVTDTWVSYKPSTIMTKGKHTAELSVADVAGNIGTLAWDFSIEEDAPAITDVIPSGSINDDMPIISAKYSDTGTGIDLSSVTMTLNGDVVSATVGNGEVSYSVKEPLKPGVGYSIGIRVADKAGNIATASGSFKLEVTAPIISGMSPTGTIQSVDVAVSANYSDAGAGIDLTTALMKVDGVVVSANASASGISYQATKLMHGDHTVYVEVADQFGNPASQNWTFKVEETAPAIATIEPNSEVNTATPVLKATYSDAGTGVNVASVVLSLNGQILPAIATASQVSYEILNPLEKGVTYKVSVQVADKAGNIASKDSSFSLETKAPVISGTKPTGTVAETDAVKGVLITAKLADDGSGVNPESVKMWLDGAPVMANSTTENATYTAKGLSYGEHNVRLVVADMLNNVADTSWKFSVADSTPPTVTVVSPKQDAVVGVRPVIRISYADEGSGVDLTSIVVKVDDKAVSAGALAPAKPGDAKVVSAGESSYEVKLAFGSHTLSVAVKDVAGNEATAEVKFMVEGDVLEIVKAHNYPNPFRGDSTKFVFGLSKRSEVSIRVYDFTNTLVATVAEGEAKDASEKVEFSWDGTTDASGGRQLATGVYFAQVVVKTDSETKSQIIKIALVRE
jgi:hypothetical protein